MDYRDFVERARQRGRDERHQARWREGELTVKSESTPGETYTQWVEMTPWNALWFHCDCPSGLNRGHLLTPCKHAVRWAERMARDVSAVKVSDGVYWFDAVPTNPARAASITWAADRCARRRIEHLRLLAASGLDMTDKEHRELRRLEELVSRLDELESR